MIFDYLNEFKDQVVSGYADRLSLTWQGGLPGRFVEAAEADPDGADQRNRSLAVVCHAYYTDLLQEVKTVVRNLPSRTDIYLSVADDEAAEVARHTFADWTNGDVEIKIVDNRGRDIAPKYVAFAHVFDREYDAVLFLHTKKSTDPVLGEAWRRYLFDCLAGSTERVQGVLGLFDRDPLLGVVAPAHFEPISEWIGWNGNYARFRGLAFKMGFRPHSWSPPDFPSGSMFWARPEALAAIKELHLKLADFPRENAQIKNTVMHALERLVYVAARRDGYRAVVLKSEASARIGADRVVTDAKPGLRIRINAFLFALRLALPTKVLLGRRLHLFFEAARASARPDKSVSDRRLGP